MAILHGKPYFLQIRVQFITAPVLGFDLIFCASMREDHSLSAFAKRKGPRMDDKVCELSIPLLYSEFRSEIQVLTVCLKETKHIQSKSCELL